MADDTNAAKQSASSLDLPAEIRNEIYELSGCVQPRQCSECKRFILGENIDMHPHHTWFDDVPEPLTLEICKIVLPRHCSRNMESLVTKVKIEPSSSPTYRTITSEHILRQPALTRVSKQVREDTLPIFYGSFTFYLPVLDPVVTIKMLDWLEAKTHPKLFRDVRVAWSGRRFEGSWEKA
ncbi:hypothetical protein Slin14017_G074110 [Septoria linicola]|nr:hypothetical protein Slin14017_G074110 [Septoria linicola]